MPTVPLPPAGDGDWYDWADDIHTTAHGAAQASGLAAVATSGSATDLTTGTLNDARIPPAITRDTELTAHTSRTDNPHAVTKTQVGLGSVDNTSDVNKPVSTAMNTALTTGLAGKVDKTALSSPIAGLNTTKLRMTKVEAVSVPNNAEQVLLNVTGPGVVHSVWLALAGGAAVDGRLRVYYDGSATATIDIDFGTLFATHYGAGHGQHWTQYMAVDMGGGNRMGINVGFQMPFGTSIKVAYFNPSGASFTMFSQVAYRLTTIDQAFGWRLRASSKRLADQQVTRTSAQATTLANITGGPGAIVWHSYVAGIGSTNRTWLERNITVAVDGEGTAAIQASGTEDWFDSAWYFDDQHDYKPSWNTWVGRNEPTTTPFIAGMAVDLLAKWGGIPFTSSAIMTVESAGATTGDSLSYCVLYYQ